MGPRPGVRPTDLLIMEMKGPCWGQRPCPPSTKRGGRGEGRAPFRPRPGGRELYLGAWPLWGSRSRQDRVPLEEGASEEEAGRWRCLVPTRGQAQGPRHSHGWRAHCFRPFAFMPTDYSDV